MLDWFKKKLPSEPKTLGQIGEEFAQAEYKKQGFKVIDANYFYRKGKRAGEIDFIATDKHRIIFVEVKTRASEIDRFGTAQDSVNQFKQIKLLKAVKLFLLNNPKFAKFKPQIDVCVVMAKDFSQLTLVEMDPAKYIAKVPVDKLPFSATIIPNAVEDWG